MRFAFPTLSKTLTALGAVYISLACLAVAQVPATPTPATAFGAPKPEECDLSVNINDSGEIYLNGVSILKCPEWQKPYQTPLTLKKGDVLTAIVNDIQGGSSPGLAILVFKKSKPDRPFLTAKDFRYATDIKPDWKTDASPTGFRRSALKPLQGVVLSGHTNTQAAWPDEKDRHFVTTYYKCVVP